MSYPTAMNQSLTLLVDAPSLVYRALFSTPDSVQTPEGRPINAAHGFLRMLARLVADQDPDYICCATDSDWRPQWRVDLVGTYKAHRAAEGSAQEEADRRLESQTPVAFELLRRCGIAVIGHPGYEAEDVIGTLSARAPGRVAIFSGDRDLFQLVEDPQCFVLYPVRGVSEMQMVDETFIANRYGIPGRSYRDYAVLRGDPSDGLPGVRGIGDKLAASLLNRYGSLDGIIAAAKSGAQGIAIGKIRRDVDYVTRAQQVVTIQRNLPIPTVDLRRPRAVAADSVVPLAERFALGGAVRSLLAALGR